MAYPNFRTPESVIEYTDECIEIYKRIAEIPPNRAADFVEGKSYCIGLDFNKNWILNKDKLLKLEEATYKLKSLCTRKWTLVYNKKVTFIFENEEDYVKAVLAVGGQCILTDT